MSKDNLWAAINRYCAACGGSPSTRIYGNTERQLAVVNVEKAVYELNSELNADLRERAELAEAYMQDATTSGGALEQECNKLRAENEQLKETLGDYENDAKAAMRESCGNNELHCTCVPALRSEVKRLQRVISLYKLVEAK